MSSSGTQNRVETVPNVVARRKRKKIVKSSPLASALAAQACVCRRYNWPLQTLSGPDHASGNGHHISKSALDSRRHTPHPTFAHSPMAHHLESRDIQNNVNIVIILHPSSSSTNLFFNCLRH